MNDNIRNKFDTFIFDKYEVSKDESGIKVTYTYKIDKYVFTPDVFISNSDISKKDIDDSFLDYLFFNFGIINAINYYKLTFSKNMVINCGYLNEEQKSFFKKLFYNGLGECMYVNNLKIKYNDFLNIKTTDGTLKKYDIGSEYTGNLIPVGGGKDSVVSIELLKGYENMFFLYNRNIYPKNISAYETIKTAGYDENLIKSFNVTLDKLMLDLNKEGFYNGHIPFSSNLAFASIILAYLNNKKYVVLSNEASSNEVTIKDLNINHQYSKSFEFENDFNNYLEKFVTSKIKYFSLLRTMNEYQIVQRFLQTPKYLNVFRSCNRGTKANSWCGNCSKCLYVYIMLYPFVSDDKLIKIFNCNMLDKKDMLDTFKGLVQPDLDKPFECVGTKEEVNYSLMMGLKLKENVPYLLKYYKDNLFDENTKYDVENYYNNQNNIPKEYLKLVEMKNEE